MSSTSHSTTHRSHHGSHGHSCGAWCGRANWSAINIGVMVAGFVLFWPVGLFILFWIVSGRDVQTLPGAIRRLWSSVSANWTGRAGADPQGPTDNVVFNEFQQAQYERIREIKDEIKSRARRFEEFRSNARRRADEDEFHRFMSDAPNRDEG